MEPRQAHRRRLITAIGLLVGAAIVSMMIPILGPLLAMPLIGVSGFLFSSSLRRALWVGGVISAWGFLAAAVPPVLLAYAPVIDDAGHVVDGGSRFVFGSLAGGAVLALAFGVPYFVGVWVGVADARRAPSRLPQPLAPAGWYVDPESRGSWRYWDGAVWAPRVSDGDPVRGAANKRINSTLASCTDPDAQERRSCATRWTE